MNSPILKTPRNSFIIHHCTVGIIKALTNEQAGELLKEIVNYSIELNNPTEPKKPSGLNSLIDYIVHPFKMQLERDFIKYQEVCKKK